jgi:hypothetical protein
MAYFAWHTFPAMNMCVYDGRARFTSPSNFERSTGWTRYDTESHGEWVRVATSVIEHVPIGDLQSDVPPPGARFSSYSRISLMWQLCGLAVRPKVSGQGTMCVVSHEFALEEALTRLARGAVKERTPDQVAMACAHAWGWGCDAQCQHCHLCRFSIFTQCVQAICPSNTRVAVKCAMNGTDNDGNVTMDFFASPAPAMYECAGIRDLNAFSFVMGGVYRDPKRCPLDKSAVFRCVRDIENDGSFQDYMDRVRADGWEAKIKRDLRTAGVVLDPRLHQTAAILAMLKMEGRDVHTDAPEYRGGVSGLLEASHVRVDERTFVSSLTGAPITQQTAHRAIANARGGILALPPGTGKTFVCVALGALEWKPGKLAATIVCPEHLALHWQREIRKAVPDATVIRPQIGDDRDPATVDTPTFAIDPEGISSDPTMRIVVDEAHTPFFPLVTRGPASERAVWAVTTEPFSNEMRGAGATEVSRIFNRVGRYFGLPTISLHMARFMRLNVRRVLSEPVINCAGLASTVLPGMRNFAIAKVEIERNEETWIKISEAIANRPDERRRVNRDLVQAAAAGVIVDVSQMISGGNRFDPFPAWSSLPPADTVSKFSDECAICFVEIHRLAATTLPCGHAFHHECMRTLHATHDARAAGARSCPVCRSTFVYSGCKRHPVMPGTILEPPCRKTSWDFVAVHAHAVDILAEHLGRREGKVVVTVPEIGAGRLMSILRECKIGAIDATRSFADDLSRKIDDFVGSSEAAVILFDQSNFLSGINLSVANMIVAYPIVAESMNALGVSVFGNRAGNKRWIQRLDQKHPPRIVELSLNLQNVLHR